MKFLFSRFFTLAAILFFTSSLFGQNIQLQPTGYTSTKLETQFQDFKVFAIPEVGIKALKTDPQQVLTLDFGGDHVWNLSLFERELLAENYFYEATDETGTTRHDNPGIHTFYGNQINNDQQEFALTVSDNFFYGYLESDQGVFYFEPIPGETLDGQQLVVFYDQNAVLFQAENWCAVTEQAKHEGSAEQYEDQGRMMMNCRVIELAIAADFSMVQKFTNNAGVISHITGVMNNVQNNYDDEFTDEIRFSIVQNFISACSSCNPWSTSNNAGTLLSSFRNWGPGGFSARHDLGGLWTNRNFSGSTIGIAYLGVLCGNSRYHCIQDFSTSATLLRVVTAHEIGHNLDASHDNSGSPFIMAPAVNTSNTWSNASITDVNNEINFAANVRRCLGNCIPDAPPVANFTTTDPTGCTPFNVQFTDQSTNNPTSWNWSFPGGTPATSNQENPVITYNTPGTYTVSMTATNAQGSNTVTRNALIQVSGTPTADFSVTQNGATVFFFDQTVPTPTAYFWDFGDGNTSTQANPTHTYAADGTYQVVLRVNSPCGPTTDTDIVTIATVPTSDFTSSNPDGCAPLVVNYISNSPTATSYSWSFPGGSPFTSNTQDQNVRYDIPGVYDVTLTVANSAGSDTETSSNYVTVRPRPIAAFTSSESGGVYTFTNASQNSSLFFWDFGDGNTSSETNPTHIYQNEGTYTVELIATNGCGTTTFQQVINTFTQPTASFTSINTDGCAPLSAVFRSTASANTQNILWEFPGGSPATSTQQDVTIVYDTPGTYTVRLIANNPSFNDTLEMVDLVVVGQGPNPSFTASTTGATATFTNTSSNTNSVSWDFGDGTTSTSTNPTHTYATDGVYTVSLTGSNDCGPVTVTDQLTIITPPQANFTASTTTGCAPLSVNYQETASENSTSFAWTFTGGTPSTSTAASPTVVYNQEGTFDARLIVTNSAGTDTFELSNIVVSTTPTPGFTTAVTGDEVTFTNTSTNALSTNWNFGDGNMSSDNDPTHTYATDGTYTVTLEATNACGTSTSTETVTIETPPTAGFTSSATAGCAPFTVNYQNDASTNAATFAWSFEGGTPATSTDANPTIQYNQSGTFSAQLIVSNTAGMDTIEFNNYIDVDAAPQSSFSSSVTNLAVSFTSTSVNANSFSWNFGDSTTSTDENPTHTYATDGTYTVTLQATNGCGTTTSTETVTIETPPTAGFTSSATAGCAPFTVNYQNDASANAATFAWSFEGGTPVTSTDANPTVQYNQSGTFSAQLIVSNTAGMDTIEFNNYIDVDAAPQSSFNSSVTNLAVSFTNTSVNANSFSWNFGDSTTSMDENPTHTYATDGTYTVTLQATNGCGTTTSTETVTIATPPTAQFQASTNAGCAPLAVSFTNQSSDNSATYAWSFPGGNPATSTAENPTVTFATAGTYTATLTVTNAAGTNSFTSTTPITVDDVPTAGSLTATINGPAVDFDLSTQNATSIAWNFGDGTTSDQNNPNHTYADNGTYTVTSTITNGCGSITVTEMVDIDFVPTAAFSINAAGGCAPFAAQFTNTSSANATSYAWSFPGGTPATSTDETPSVTYATAGTYSVELIAFSPWSTDTVRSQNSITVTDVPTADFATAVNLGTVAFTDQSTGQIDAYLWNFGDGNTSTDANPTHTYLDEGFFTATLEVTNACGTTDFSLPVAIATQGPLAAFSADSPTGCEPFDVQFENLSSENSVSWEWSFPGGTPATSSAENPMVTYASAGTYTVELIATNTLGRDTFTLTDYITVNPLPVADFEGTVDLNSVDFSNGSANGSTYSWTFGDGNSSTEENPTHEYEAPGIYTVTLVATNACGTSSVQNAIEIETTVPDLQYMVSQTSGCADLTVNFTDQSTNNPTTWAWSFPGGTPATSTDQNPTVVYSTPGVYDVTLNAGNFAGPATLVTNEQIEVLGVPTVDVVVNSAVGLSYSLSANATGGQLAYSWDMGDGSPLKTTADISHTYAESGSYTIVLTVTNECGTVTEETTLDIITSTFEVADLQSFELFPNPNNGIFTISIKGKQRAVLQLNIVNVLGQSVYSQSLNFLTGSIAHEVVLDQAPSGLYFLQLRDGDQVTTERVVIE